MISDHMLVTLSNHRLIQMIKADYVSSMLHYTVQTYQIDHDICIIVSWRSINKRFEKVLIIRLPDHDFIMPQFWCCVTWSELNHLLLGVYNDYVCVCLCILFMVMIISLLTGHKNGPWCCDRIETPICVSVPHGIYLDIKRYLDSLLLHWKQRQTVGV